MITLDSLKEGDLFKIKGGICTWKIIDLEPIAYSKNSVLCQCINGPKRKGPYIKAPFNKYIEVEEINKKK